jgi:hypothetical protein
MARASNHINEGGFACAICANNGKPLTSREFKINTICSDDTTESKTQTFGSK